MSALLTVKEQIRNSTSVSTEHWIQLEFDFGEPEPQPQPEAPVKKAQRKPRKPVDYEKIYEALQWGPLTFNEIEIMTGVPHCAVAQVITTLSLKYPIWSPRRGVYKLADETDYL